MPANLQALIIEAKKRGLSGYTRGGEVDKCPEIGSYVNRGLATCTKPVGSQRLEVTLGSLGHIRGSKIHHFSLYSRVSDNPCSQFLLSFEHGRRWANFQLLGQISLPFLIFDKILSKRNIEHNSSFSMRQTPTLSNFSIFLIPLRLPFSLLEEFLTLGGF